MDSRLPDQDAEHLYRDHDELVRLAKGIVHDEGEAELVVSEAFTKLIETPPADRSNLSGWLRQIVRNGCRDSLRRRKIETRTQNQLPQEPPPEVDPQPISEEHDTTGGTWSCLHCVQTIHEGAASGGVGEDDHGRRVPGILMETSCAESIHGSSWDLQRKRTDAGIEPKARDLTSTLGSFSTVSAARKELRAAGLDGELHVSPDGDSFRVTNNGESIQCGHRVEIDKKARVFVPTPLLFPTEKARALYEHLVKMPYLPTRKEMAADLECDGQTVARCLKKLEKAGFISRSGKRLTVRKQDGSHLSDLEPVPSQIRKNFRRQKKLREL